jgi:hypothetical protein
MADAKQTVPKDKAESKPNVDLADGSTATDPVVHQLLAERSLLAQEDERARAAIDAAWLEIDGRKERHEGITRRLAELGYR